MTRPSFIQSPTYWQLKAVYDLVQLNRKLVAGHFGNLLHPELAIDFRAAIGCCTRQFDLPATLDAFERDLEVISEVLRSKVSAPNREGPTHVE